MRSPLRPLYVTAITAAMFATVSCSIQPIAAFPRAATTSATAEHTTSLIRVVDGDTIAVLPTEALPATNEAGTEHAVRLLGIDAPEMHKVTAEPPECGAEAATAYLTSLVATGVDVTVVYDERSDHTDRYGRSLAYVQSPTIGDLGREVVEAGYAEAWYPKGEPEPARYAEYAATELEAASAGAGAHSTCSSIGR